MMSSTTIFYSIIMIAFVSGSSFHERRVLRSNENIAAHILAVGDSSPRFTITAEAPEDDINAFTSSSTVSMDVVRATPAITQDTYIELADGTPIRFGDSSIVLDTLLVSDTTTSAGRSGLTILAVDPITQETQGVVEQKGRKSLTLRQGADGGVATVSEEEKMEVPAWECGVGHHDDTLLNRALEEESHHEHEVS